MDNSLLHVANPLQELTSSQQVKLLELIDNMESELLDLGSNRQLNRGVNSILQNASQPDHRVELDFMLAASIVNTLQTAKNAHYDNSYSKRGLLSIFFNMERKWERIDKGIFHSIGDAGSETFMDTLGDMAAYSMKLFAWYAIRNPVAYSKWLNTVRKEAEAVNPFIPNPQVLPRDTPCLVVGVPEEAVVQVDYPVGGPAVEPPLTHPCGCPLQDGCIGHEGKSITMVDWEATEAASRSVNKDTRATRYQEDEDGD